MLLYHESRKMSIKSKKTASVSRAAFLDILLNIPAGAKNAAFMICADARIPVTFSAGNFLFTHIDVFPAIGYTIIMRSQIHNEGGVTQMVFEKLKDIILDQLDVDEDQITMDADFVDDLQADSLDVATMMEAVADEFDIAVPENIVDSISTVGDAVRFIEEYINE